MQYSVQDSINVRRNQVTVLGSYGPAYNAVISVTTSNEGADSISFQEVKDWCYIDKSDFDSALAILIPAAREICEQYANLSFVTRNVVAIVRNDLGNIKLPLGPSIGAVTFKNSDAITLTDYTLLKPNASGEITLSYAAGYTTLPSRLKLAWLNQILYLFENRDKDASIGPVTKGILKPLRNV